MDDDGKRRAADRLAAEMARNGWSVPRLAVEAKLDPATIRKLLDAESWPWAEKRLAMETALGMEPGTLELVARGLLEEPAGDPVVRAIQGSALTRGNKATLTGTYYDMLDEQQERGAG